MLKIENLHVDVDGKPILNGIDLDGERRRGARDHGTERLRQEHARERARGTRGLRRHAGQRALTRARTCSRCAPEERAREGVFLAFQYPVEIPGVSNLYFLKAARERGRASTAARSRSTRWSS